MTTFAEHAEKNPRLVTYITIEQPTKRTFRTSQ